LEPLKNCTPSRYRICQLKHRPRWLNALFNTVSDDHSGREIPVAGRTLQAKRVAVVNTQIIGRRQVLREDQSFGHMFGIAGRLAK
jgi:hypothetical protein